MFRRQINTPHRFLLKDNSIFFHSLLQHHNRLRIRQPLEGVVKDVAEAVTEADFAKGGSFKEFQIIGTHGESIFDAILEVVFGQVNVVRQIGKGNFGFNHPEFAQMTCRVGIFRPKGGTKGIHIRESTRVRLHIQLSRYGQVGPLPKEIISIIHCTNDLFFRGFIGFFLFLAGLLLLGQTLFLLVGHFLDFTFHGGFGWLVGGKGYVGFQMVRAQEGSDTKLFAGTLAIRTG
mmetsp:Transcript_24584/g.44487  ORF Transcript_24584/g.44487 Transcript_24584/m.44487 type:complete len:232 (-) Transcript_24584:204-899(-)